MYKVVFRSKDDHLFEMSLHAKSEMDAVFKAEQQIIINGWSQYHYVFEEIIKL